MAYIGGKKAEGRLVLMYKIVNGLVKIDATDRHVQPSRLSRNMGQYFFQIPSCNTIIRKESFYPRTIRDWNALPTDTATANPSRLTYLIKLIKLFLLAHLFCTALYC